MAFSHFGKQVAAGFVSLDEVIGDDGVHDVFGAPFWHMARGAIAIWSMFAGAHKRLKRIAVTLTANRVVAVDGALAARRVMRVVAGGASELAPALAKALRLPQPVDGRGDLEFVFVPGTRRVIKVDDGWKEKGARPSFWIALGSGKLVVSRWQLMQRSI